jgi:hypothetical protein
MGAGDQVTDGPGHDNLAGADGGHDPGSDVDGDPAHVIAAQLDLTDVVATRICTPSSPSSSHSAVIQVPA